MIHRGARFRSHGDDGKDVGDKQDGVDRTIYTRFKPDPLCVFGRESTLLVAVVEGLQVAARRIVGEASAVASVIYYSLLIASVAFFSLDMHYYCVASFHFLRLTQMSDWL